MSPPVSMLICCSQVWIITSTTCTWQPLSSISFQLTNDWNNWWDSTGLSIKVVFKWGCLLTSRKPHLVDLQQSCLNCQNNSCQIYVNHFHSSTALFYLLAFSTFTGAKRWPKLNHRPAGLSASKNDLVRVTLSSTDYQYSDDFIQPF